METDQGDHNSRISYGNRWISIWNALDLLEPVWSPGICMQIHLDHWNGRESFGIWKYSTPILAIELWWAPKKDSISPFKLNKLFIRKCRHYSANTREMLR